MFREFYSYRSTNLWFTFLHYIRDTHLYNTQPWHRTGTHASHTHSRCTHLCYTPSLTHSYARHTPLAPPLAISQQRSNRESSCILSPNYSRGSNVSCRALCPQLCPIINSFAISGSAIAWCKLGRPAWVIW